MNQPIDAMREIAAFLAAGPLDFVSKYYPYAELLPDGTYYIDASGDLTPLLVNDHQGSYFYLRLNGAAGYREVSRERVASSCSARYELVANVRLVLVANGIDPFAAAARLHRDLQPLAWQGLASGVRAALVSANYGMNDVLRGENYPHTELHDLLLRPQLRVISADLQMSIPAADDCLEIPVCLPAPPACIDHTPNGCGGGTGGGGPVDCDGVPVCNAIEQVRSLAEDASDEAASAQVLANTANQAAANALLVARANARQGGFVWGTNKQEVVPYCSTQAHRILSAAFSWGGIRRLGQVIAFVWKYNVQLIEQISIYVETSSVSTGAQARLVMARIDANNNIVGPSLMDATYALDVPGIKQLLASPMPAPNLGEKIALITLANSLANGASTAMVSQDRIDNAIAGSHNYTSPTFMASRTITVSNPAPPFALPLSYPFQPELSQFNGGDRVNLYVFELT